MSEPLNEHERNGCEGEPNGNQEWDRHRGSRDILEKETAHCRLGLIDEARKHGHLPSEYLGFPERAEDKADDRGGHQGRHRLLSDRAVEGTLEVAGNLLHALARLAPLVSDAI